MTHEPSPHPAGTSLSDWLLGRINYERTGSVPFRSGQVKLERMRRLLAALGDPQAGLPIVHVAGTKGKGSTAAMIAAILTSAGYRTGLFTSPHLDRVEERMMIDGTVCSSEAFEQLGQVVRSVVQQMDLRSAAPRDRSPAEGSRKTVVADRPVRGPTYFEITTAMALLHFARQSVDACVLEVGLGGRLDSTNVCQPRLSVITSISFDHTRVLGNTLEAIAREKAGIIKPSVPVVCGVRDDGPRQVIHETARENGCRLVQAGRDFDYRYHPPRGVDLEPLAAAFDFVDHTRPAASLENVQLRLLGRHQAANASLALASVEELKRQGWSIPSVAARSGLARAELPARFEVLARCPTVVIDAAHNLASVESLIQLINESCVLRPRTLVFACSQDKDAAGMLSVMAPHFDRIVLTRYTENPRAVPVDELARIAASVTARPLIATEDPVRAWEVVRDRAESRELIIVSGSFFLAAEMRRLAGAAPISLSAGVLREREPTA